MEERKEGYEEKDQPPPNYRSDDNTCHQKDALLPSALGE
jgi:hypothetical protein